MKFNPGIPEDVQQRVYELTGIYLPISMLEDYDGDIHIEGMRWDEYVKQFRNR